MNPGAPFHPIDIQARCDRPYSDASLSEAARLRPAVVGYGARCGAVA